MSSPQVASMTVDELKAVIAEAIDERFRQLLSIVSVTTSLPEISSSTAIDRQLPSHIAITITPSRSSIETTHPQMTGAEVAGEHPWLKLAGIYKDNPLFDEVMAEIEARRHEGNASEIFDDRETDIEDSDA